MQLTSVLLLAFSLQVSAVGYAQKVTISEKDASLKKVFREIRKQTGYFFIYTNELIQRAAPVTIHVKDANVQEVLNICFSNQPLSYTIDDRIIIVKPRPIIGPKPQAPPPPDITITPERQINGVVSDSTTGNPLAGVTIQVKGGSSGTVTDGQGRFVLVVPDDATLVVSYLGYNGKEVAVGSRNIIRVALAAATTGLNQLVVVGYGTQKRSDVTGSIVSVNASQIKDEPALQVGQALQGKVPGLQISQNSGAPGSGILIRVRGSGTVNNSEPLYVVDGNPTVDPIDLAPDQIESIQVLKSASAAAIYGAQGANGVVLITTKQGRAGKTQFNVNVSQGWQQMQRKFPVTNAWQYATLYNEGLVNGGEAPIFDDPKSLGVGTDWQDQVFQVAPMSKVSMSVNGGSETSRFFMSAGYIDQEGIIKGSSFNRLNFRVNSSHDITPHITIGENLSASFAKYNQISEFNFGSILGNTLTANPTIPVKMPDGGWGYSETSLNSSNPLASISFTHNNTKRPVLNGNIYANITFLKNFVFHSQANINLGYSANSNFSPAYHISTRNYRDIASLTETTNRFKDYSWVNTLTYTKAFGVHHLSILAGTTTQESHLERVSAHGEGLPLNATDNPNLRYLDLNTSGNSVSGNAGEWGLLSFLGRVNYDYKGKYFSTINFRADGSSKFGENNKFGYFPSFSLGWKLSEENFMKGAGWINNLMLRGGWGSLGNQSSLPNYAYANLVTANINYVFGDPQQVIRGKAPTGAGNPNLRWEATKETDLGLDFNGFNGKLSASVDWYHKTTDGLLLQIPLVGYAGIEESPYVNGGEILNQGFEFMAGYQNTTPGGFGYDISANIAFNKNKVMNLSNGGTALNQFISFVGLINVTQVGSPIASFWGWKTDGIFQTQEEVNKHAFQSSGTAPGDIRFVDLNGDGTVNANDQTVIGNPWPKFTYGFNTNFSYKNFDLRMQFQGTYGNDIFMAYKFRMDGANFFNYSKDVWDHRWTGPGTSNSYPRLTTSDPNNNLRSSDYYIKDGSYLRLKNFQLGYRVPQSLVHVRSLRVYVQIHNALTFTKYPGLDPEIGTNRDNNPLYIGIDETNYPVPRIYTIGIDFGL
jgi:TonB-linked SusC/RagA family outer membrane protein